MAAPQIEGRYLLVGHAGLPVTTWTRVLHYQHPDGLYRPAETIVLSSSLRIVDGVELLILDPLSGERWMVKLGEWPEWVRVMDPAPPDIVVPPDYGSLHPPGTAG